MPFNSFLAPATGKISNPRGRCSSMVLLWAIVPGMLTLAGFAQMSQPSQAPHPAILQEANRPPDANKQMIMREENARNRNFDAANVERLKQLMQASQALETMAIALKAEVDKSGDPSENTIHKAETIEKLAHIVEERMKLSVAPN